jgi:hypothetical protein
MRLPGGTAKRASRTTTRPSWLGEKPDKLATPTLAVALSGAGSGAKTPRFRAVFNTRIGRERLIGGQPVIRTRGGCLPPRPGGLEKWVSIWVNKHIPCKYIDACSVSVDG